MKSLLLMLGLATATLSPCLADDPASPVGNWEGLLPVNAAMELRLVFHVEKAKDGTLKATFDSPDESIPGLAAEATAKNDGSIAIAVPIIKGVYEGKLDAKGEQFTGTWKQGGKDYPVKLSKMTAPEPTPEIWEGKLKLGVMEVRLVARVTKKADGTLRATLDSPDQGAKALKVDKVTRDKTRLAFELKALKARIRGEDEQRRPPRPWASGSRRARPFPLTMKKTDKVSELQASATAQEALSLSRGDGHLSQQAGRDHAGRDPDHPARGRAVPVGDPHHRVGRRRIATRRSWATSRSSSWPTT